MERPRRQGRRSEVVPPAAADPQLLQHRDDFFDFRKTFRVRETAVVQNIPDFPQGLEAALLRQFPNHFPRSIAAQHQFDLIPCNQLPHD